jgi:hypothetical protein
MHVGFAAIQRLGGVWVQGWWAHVHICHEGEWAYQEATARQAAEGW